MKIERLHVFWMTGMSCDGCTIAVAGATEPGLEDLLNGWVPGLPQIILHHPVLAVESGKDFMKWVELAAEGKLDAPFVSVLEGSVPDETLAKEYDPDGYWDALGEKDGKPVPMTDWLWKMREHCAAAIAIGTCATWGGIPAAHGNATGAMSLMDFYGKDWKSQLGVPVINVPGCSPIGDNFMETVVAVLMFLNGMAPLPEFDELGRPAWLFGETVHRHCPRAGYYEEGDFAKDYGSHKCLVEIGCWGPVVQCNIVERGMIRGVGGCMQMGGICIGCTMPGFPDKFTPYFTRPVGAEFSTTASRLLVKSWVVPLRRLTMKDKNREPRWDRLGDVPSGWARHIEEPHALEKVVHKLAHWVQQGR